MKANKTPPLLFSIRMRATGPDGSHISGAEGIYKKHEINSISLAYTERALKHPKGKPEHINISIEELKKAPLRLKALDVCTMKSSSQAESEEAIRALLLSVGITKRAINAAYKILKAKKAMRGAAIITVTTGKRIEPDRLRGVRARLIGIEKKAANSMYKKLDKYGLANDTVLEALTLATKVASTPNVVAELCASDDPHYTTGYVALNRPGYIRIPHIKKAGSASGGRVIFVGENTDPDEVIGWLEKVPVIVGYTGIVMGSISINNINCRQVGLQKLLC